jgi:predicted GTPase
LNQEKFKVSPSTESETDRVSGFVTHWLSDPKEEMPVIVTDTPGFGDSMGRDTAHIADMVFKLKQIGYVHTFLITLNSENPRFDE